MHKPVVADSDAHKGAGSNGRMVCGVVGVEVGVGGFDVIFTTIGHLHRGH